MNITMPKNNRLFDYFQWGALGLFLLFLSAEVVLALGWRMQHDTPLLHYVAFLIDKHHFTPYKDVFETSMPGTLLFHLAIGKALGYSDAAFRTLDMLYLLAFLAVTWILMRPFGKAVACGSVLLFGLIYMGHGPSMSLQRDYVGILPIAIALLVATRAASKTYAQWSVIGALFALSASIKPHLAIGLPAVIAYGAVTMRNGADTLRAAFGMPFLRMAGAAAIGFIVVWSLPFIWLWTTGGFPYFREMFASYLPLHIQLTGDHAMVSGMARIRYLLDSYRNFGGLGMLLVPAALGIHIALSEQEDRYKTRFVLLLLALLGLYSIYPALSGQFWDYHWMPFAYFGSLCGALVLLPQARFVSVLPHAAYRRAVPLMVFLFALALLVHMPGDFTRQIAGKEPVPPKDGKVDEIAGFLKSHLRPGDKIQPLDWTGGALHAALISEAVVATPYIYDYHFYHHVSKPQIQHIRQKFISDLQAEQPRYIIDMIAKPRPTGQDTTTEFPELQTLLATNYAPVHRGNGYVILERKPDSAFALKTR